MSGGCTHQQMIPEVGPTGRIIWLKCANCPYRVPAS